MKKVPDAYFDTDFGTMLRGLIKAIRQA